ncbi:MAG: hypothetical protein WDO73_35695 [Ignavibacteriota bacterium]
MLAGSRIAGNQGLAYFAANRGQQGFRLLNSGHAEHVFGIHGAHHVVQGAGGADPLKPDYAQQRG